ncbi:MAG: hypothetical protein ACREGG_03625, partial [Candidatus Saccharimonadales bacterium]
MTTSSENNVAFVSFVEGSEEENLEKLKKYFSFDAAHWASIRAREFGDFIVPKFACIKLSGQVIDGVPTPTHFTYYVEHAGTLITDTDIEHYHRHHMVCDHVLERNLNDGKGGVNVNACPDLKTAATIRAQRFGKEIRSGIAGAYGIEDELEKLISSGEVAIAALEKVLELDHTIPEIWPGTIVSGELSLEQASEITGQPPEDVARYADILQLEGKVSFDGQT